jgi:head-tail adaptor
VLEQQENQVRYRFRWRDGIDSSMRIREGARTFQIVGGPAELGRKEWLEVDVRGVRDDRRR